MEDKKMYSTIFQIDKDKQQILGVTLDYKQAFTIAQNFLNQNENVKSEQVFVEEYFLKKVLKIVDIKE
jgi:hypothetical protein